MSTRSSSDNSAVGGIRIALGLGGLVAIVLGVLILVWPGRTAEIVTALIAIYAVLAGLVYLCIGIFTKERGGWSRVGQILLGVVFIVAGIIAFANLGQATAWLAVFLGILVGIMWIVEGIVALSTLGDASSKGWSLFFAILSIVAGIIVLFSPLWGIAILWWLLGISMIVLGIMNLFRAFTFGRGR